jgi:hypothetical protein
MVLKKNSKLGNTMKCLLQRVQAPNVQNWS